MRLFASSGSSVAWFIVKNTSGQSTVPGRFLIVAVRMEELEVRVLVWPALGQRHAVVDFPAVLRRKEQSTLTAAAALLLE